MNLDYVLRHVSSYHSKVDGSEQPQTPQFSPAIKYLPVQFVDELRCAGVVISSRDVVDSSSSISLNGF